MDQLLDLLDSSDDELLPPLPVPIVEENDEIGIVAVLGNIIQDIVRNKHVKVKKYVENIVQQYIPADFVTHFRLSRSIVYELISKFSRSDIYLSLRQPGGHQVSTTYVSNLVL